MSIRIQIFSVAIGLMMFGLILEMVRRKRLREEYSILWLFVGSLMIIIPIWKNGLFSLARFLHVADASALLFLFGIVFLSVFTVHLSVAMTEVKEEREKIAIEIALLKQSLEEIGTRR